MLELVERGFFSSTIKLSDASRSMPASVEPDVQVLRVGKFQHPKYGEFEITTAVLTEMKAHFDNKIRGIDIALDYFHDSDKEASGWIKELYLSEDSDELWARVEWTPKARRMLSEREVRYFSPDFAFKWTDPETQITYTNVLFGGGLTNRPFVKEMAAIVASEKQGDAMKMEDLEKKVLKLAEDGDALAKKHADLQKAHSDLMAKHADLQKKLEEMDEPDGDEDGEGQCDDDGDEPKDLESAKKQLADMKSKLAEYAEKAKQAEAAKQLAEKEKTFNLLLTEGKACAAQKDAYLKGDMEAFVKLAEKVNLSAKGSGGGSSDTTGDREDRVMKLAEEKCKSDPKLAMHDAIKLANKEIKD